MQPGRSIVEQLETRQLLTFSATLAGSTATFTVGNTLDSVIFSQDGSGNLQHNTLTAPTGESFADNLDFDSTVALSQHLAAAAGSTVDVQGTAYNATIGTPSAPASTLLANFGLDGNAGSTATIDDSGSGTANTYTATAGSITATGINVNLTGPAFGGGVGLTTGSGANTVNVQGDSSPLTVTDPGGTDTINVGDAGSLAGLTKALTISNPGGGTSVNVDDSADPANTNATLIANGTNTTTATLTGLGTAPITLPSGVNGTLTILGGTGTDTQTIDFSAGDPIPKNVTYQGGGASTLILQGAIPGNIPIPTEVFNATGPGSGDITLSDTTIDFSGLKPVIDTTAVNVFSFNYTGGLDAQISVGAGAVVNGQPTTLISSTASTPQFEQVSYANKSQVGIGTGAGNDVVSVTGSALQAGSTTSIDGQGGVNTLNYNAGGSPVVVTSTGTPGESMITRAGSGSLLVANFQQINIINGQFQAGPVVQPAVGAAPTLKGTAGAPLTNVDVATFTAANPTATSSSFGATINWGDGATTAGTVVPDASNPTLYHVEGSHTYTSTSPTGGDTIAVTVTEKDINTTTLAGVTLTQTGVGTSNNTALIAGLSNTTPTTPITGATEGAAFTGTIATFSDNDPTASAGRFNATIAWGDGQVTQGTVAADPATPGQLLVGGTHTYAKAGTFSATVTIQDTIAPVGTPIVVARSVNVAGAAINQVGGGYTFTSTATQPFTSIIGSFSSANPFATASDFVATINWSDNTPSTTGIVTQGADGTFSVTGSHTYELPAPILSPYTPTVTVKELASSTTATLGDLFAAVADVPIITQGTTISAVEGKTVAGALIASFTYAVGTSNFSGTVDWGDGTTSPLTPANFQFVPLVGPFEGPYSSTSTYLVNADHTYLGQGTFPISVTIDSNNASSAVAHSTAIVADALTVNVLPLTATENLGFSNAVVATFKDAGTPDPVSKYSATINWGDGSAVVPGTIVANADGTFNVLSSHKYDAPGNFPVSVTVTNDLSGETTGTANISVAPAPLNLLGYLNKASDTGVSDTDAITKDRTPNFFGTAAPGTIIHLYAIPVGTNIPVPIGQTAANAAGAWSITSISLADGRYDIEAIGTDAAGITSALDVVLPNPLQGPLVVDTVAPKVEDVLFQPLSGQVQVTFQDNSSGLDQSQVINGANYTFTRVATLPGQAKIKGVKLPSATGYVVTGLSTSPQTIPTAPQVVEVSIDNGQPIRGGFYQFTIKSGGIEDVAGNSLDGEFYGYFPSGNNQPGGDFIANLDSVHNTVLPPLPVGSNVSPLDPPGILPTTTYIPTVAVRGTSAKSGKFSLPVNNNLTLVPIAGQSFPGKLELQESKPKPVIGKTTPLAKVAARPHVAAKKAPKSHG